MRLCPQGQRTGQASPGCASAAVLGMPGSRWAFCFAGKWPALGTQPHRGDNWARIRPCSGSPRAAPPPRALSNAPGLQARQRGLDWQTLHLPKRTHSLLPVDRWAGPDCLTGDFEVDLGNTPLPGRGAQKAKDASFTGKVTWSQGQSADENTGSFSVPF